MVITHHGGEFFKITFGDTTLAFNPISKDSTLKPTRFGADIAFVTTNHADFNGADQVSRGDKEPFLINSPGEYEVKGVAARGFLTTTTYAGAERINTVYFVSLEGMNLCFLGALSSADIPKDAKEALDSIDVLFLPVGDGDVLSAVEAHALAVRLEPKIVIPMHWSGIGEKDALKTFLKEDGSDTVKPVDKLTLKKKDLDGKAGEVVVLSS